MKQKDIQAIQEMLMKEMDKTFSDLQKLIEKQKIHEESERMKLIQVCNKLVKLKCFVKQSFIYRYN